MISIEECKKYLGRTSLTDAQIEKRRDALYAFVERGMDLLSVHDNVVIKELTCKTAKQKAFPQGQLSTAEFLQIDKRKRATGSKRKS